MKRRYSIGLLFSAHEGEEEKRSKQTGEERRGERRGKRRQDGGNERKHERKRVSIKKGEHRDAKAPITHAHWLLPLIRVYAWSHAAQEREKKKSTTNT
mmetsp:Transcript_30436/g.59805  ORF Transcript_30436/g.59805 Transcript_30436/m.59805 type:complete len:98 (-) Transcript_30436:112-405(-)